MKPEKRKLNTNIINPFIAILYTASFVPVNKRTKLFPFIKDNAKINNEPTKMKEIQILYIFFNAKYSHEKIIKYDIHYTSTCPHVPIVNTAGFPQSHTLSDG